MTTPQPATNETAGIDLRLPIAVALIALRNGGTITITDMDQFASQDINLECTVDEETKTMTITASVQGDPTGGLRLYKPPYGNPYKWPEIGGLGDAILEYLQSRMGLEALADASLDQVIAYVRYYVTAPAWNQVSDRMDDLREQAKRMSTAEHVESVCNNCLDLGLEPL